MKRTMQWRVRTYLAQRRAFGYQLRSEGYLLLNFARYADRSGHRGAPTRKVLLRWAQLPSQALRSRWARRLQLVRHFAQYWQGIEPATQVPPRHVFGSRAGRPTPWLYEPDQIKLLMRRARALSGQLKPHTYRHLIGLLACTGLRLSEALRLAAADVDLTQGLLFIRDSKYHKARWVPLHASAVRRLRLYAKRRQRLFPLAEHFWVSERGRALSLQQVENVFGRLRAGLRAQGRPPRLHDLRHTFACRVLCRWQNQPQGAHHRVAILARYLGHNRVLDTYWYLSAWPPLLAQAARGFPSPTL